MKRYLLTSFMILCLLSLGVAQEEVEEIEITTCLVLKEDEYKKLQNTYGTTNGIWYGYESGGWNSVILNTYPKIQWLETEAGWQSVWWYYDEEYTYALTFNVDNINNQTEHDGYNGIHPCGVYKIRKEEE